ncbi:MAG: YitT family protein [Christensenellaceae bacterium]
MMNRISKHRLFRQVWPWVMLAIGSYAMSRAFTIFFVPNGIAPGGVTGIATLVHVVTGASVGAVALLLNVPLFLLGYRQGGREFMAKTIVATVLVSLFIDYLPGSVTLAGHGDGDMLLATVYGGLLLGVGMGLVFRAGATTGGTDLAASLIHKKLHAVRIAWVLFAIDICVVIASAFVSDMRVALYSLAAIFLSAKVTDFVQTGFDESKASYIISEQGETVKAAIMEHLERGVTVLEAQGGYTGQSKSVLFCVTSNREVTQLKKLVAEADPEAFVIVTPATEVMGEGFAARNQNPMG